MVNVPCRRKHEQSVYCTVSWYMYLILQDISAKLHGSVKSMCQRDSITASQGKPSGRTLE